MQIVLIQLHSLMVTSGPGMGAENHITIAVTDHRIGI